MNVRTFVASAGRIGAAAALVWLLMRAPFALLLYAIRWLPTSIDPWFTIFAAQAAALVFVALLLRLPLVSLMRVAPGSGGMRAVCWLLSAEVLFAIVGAVTVVSTSDAGAVSFTVSNGLLTLTRDFPRSGIAGAVLRNAVLVPVFEEFTFRLLLLGFVLKPLRPWLALLISTALFAFVHSSWLTAAFGGLVYGVLYLRYGSVWLCILAHAANNLVIAICIPILIAYLHEIGLLDPVQDSLLVLQVTSAIVVLACLAMFVASLRRKDETASAALAPSG